MSILGSVTIRGAAGEEVAFEIEEDMRRMHIEVFRRFKTDLLVMLEADGKVQQWELDNHDR